MHNAFLHDGTILAPLHVQCCDIKYVGVARGQSYDNEVYLYMHQVLLQNLHVHTCTIVSHRILDLYIFKET